LHILPTRRNIFAMQDVAYLFATPDDADEIKRFLTRFKRKRPATGPLDIPLTASSQPVVGLPDRY
jgi:aromatic ring hydroxylase